jgi:hypothetical protein
MKLIINFQLNFLPVVLESFCVVYQCLGVDHCKFCSPNIQVLSKGRLGRENLAGNTECSAELLGVNFLGLVIRGFNLG